MLPPQASPVTRDVLSIRASRRGTGIEPAQCTCNQTSAPGVAPAQSVCDKLTGAARQICYALVYGIST